MKGQVSIEFFIYFSISLVVLSVLLTNAVDRQRETFSYREATYVDSVAQKVAFEVESADQFGSGYTRDVSLPRELNGQNYVINVSDDLVSGQLGDTRVTARVSYTGRNISLKSEEGPFEVINNGSVYIVPK